MEGNVRLGLTWRVAVRAGVGHLPSGAAACVGVFCIRGSNGNRDEPAEGRQSLFSWAYSQEEEPVQPRGRKGKPKPFSPSLLEWALGNEKEEEPVQPRGRKGKPKPFSPSLLEWALGNEKEEEPVGGTLDRINNGAGTSLVRRCSCPDCACMRPFCVLGRGNQPAGVFARYPSPSSSLLHNDEQGVKITHPQHLHQPPSQPRRRTAFPPHQLRHVTPGNSAAARQLVLRDVQLVQQFPYHLLTEHHPD